MLQKVSCNNDSPSLLVAQCATEGTCDTPLLSESIRSYTNLFDVSSLVSLSELGPALSLAPNSAEVHTIHILFQFFLICMCRYLWLIRLTPYFVKILILILICKYRLMGSTWLTFFSKSGKA